MEGFHHMIFLSNSNSGKIKDIKQRIDAQNTMFITERRGMGQFGSAISFFVDDTGRIQFELIEENFKEQDLFISSNLKTLAKKPSS